MAMLAERKRKQKWTLNPRGKQWSDDSGKFGQKMLEKMGWTSGKGLGINEQGVTEHIRVKFKDDQAGIGFSTSEQDKLWTEKQESYNLLLKNLHTTNNSSITDSTKQKKKADVQSQSLELKSKQSRARVHYQKFTRGKDVNKYSTKDLANIFGKKDMDESTKEKQKIEESTEILLNNNVGSTDVTGGVVTIMGGTIDNYFKHKEPTRMLRSKNISNNNEIIESESDNEKYVGFGFFQSNTKLEEKTLKISNCSHISGMLDLNNSEETFRKRKNESYIKSCALNKENVIDDDKKSKRRKISNNFAFENSGMDLGCCEELDDNEKNKVEPTKLLIDATAMKINIQHNENCEKKVDLIDDFKNPQLKIIGHENDGLDLTDETNGKKRVTFNDTIEYNTDSVNTDKKKQKKKQKKGNHNNKLDKYEVELDEITKKKLKNITSTPEKNSFINEALDVEIINEEKCDNESNERKSNGTKRKKKKQLNLDTIQEEDDTVKVNNEYMDIHSTQNQLKNEGITVCTLESTMEMKTTEIDKCHEVSILNMNMKRKKLINTEETRNKNEKHEIKNENEYYPVNSDKSFHINDKSIDEKKKKKKKKKRENESNYQ